MTTIEAGQSLEEPRDYIQELYDHVGVSGFPVTVTTENGVLKSILVDTEWVSGTTIPVETIVVDEETEKEQLITTYKEDYTNEKLTKAQVDKVNQWIAENIE